MNGRVGPEKTLCSLSLPLLPRWAEQPNPSTSRAESEFDPVQGPFPDWEGSPPTPSKDREEDFVPLPVGLQRCPTCSRFVRGVRWALRQHQFASSGCIAARTGAAAMIAVRKNAATTGEGHSTAGCQPIQQMTGTMNGTTMPLPMIPPTGAGMRGKNPQTIVTATNLQVLGAGVSMNGLITPATRAIATPNGATLPQARKTTGTTMSGQRAGKKGNMAGRRQVNIIRNRTKTKTGKMTKISASPMATTSPTGTGGAMRSSPVAGAGTGGRTTKRLTTRRTGVKLVQATGSPIATASATPDQRHAKTQTILGRAARGGKIAITGGGGTAAHNGH